MSFRFSGGDRVQRGRGIGGFMKIASRLFYPVVNIAKKALQSKTGRKIVDAVKEQAIDSSINIAKEIASGKNVKQSLKDEFKNVKKNTKRKALEIGVEHIKRSRGEALTKKQKKIVSNSVVKNNKKKKKKTSDIFM